ncbi:uncharacterized protein LOC118146228 [Callithrix jacchus]
MATLSQGRCPCTNCLPFAPSGRRWPGQDRADALASISYFRSRTAHVGTRPFLETRPISAPGPSVRRGRRNLPLALCPLTFAPPLARDETRASTGGSARSPSASFASPGGGCSVPHPSWALARVPPGPTRHLPLVSGRDPGEAVREAWRGLLEAAARVCGKSASCCGPSRGRGRSRPRPPVCGLEQPAGPAPSTGLRTKLTVSSIRWSCLFKNANFEYFLCVRHCQESHMKTSEITDSLRQDGYPKSRILSVAGLLIQRTDISPAPSLAHSRCSRNTCQLDE